MSDDLEAIGAVLAGAAYGDPFELTDDQRAVLARATIAETFEAILPHIATPPLIQQGIFVADRWTEELRLALVDDALPQQIGTTPHDESDAAQIREFILRDDRLTRREQNRLTSDLSDRTSNNGDGAVPDFGSGPAYIASLSVRGFRGIGQQATLDFDPQPGLTVVYGLSGTGKSSFVDALEVLFTGDAARFRGHSPAWRSAWDNVHSPSDIAVTGTFIVPRTKANDTVLHRTRDETSDEQLRQLGWSDAFAEFNPILGYAELGPLLVELGSYVLPGDYMPEPDKFDETALARHVRLRSGISDALTERIARTAEEMRKRGSIHDLVYDWWTINDSRRDGYLDSRLRNLFVGDDLADSAPITPAGLLWHELPAALDQPTHDSGVDPMVYITQKDWLLRIAHAYQDDIPLKVKDALAEISDREPFPTRRPDYFRLHGARLALYCDWLLEAIHQRRLEPFVQQVKTIWATIRRSPAVRFDSLVLKEAENANEAGRRVQLDLSVDGARVERGVLSQGELHSLALSIFLPAMIRPESPFGFAVIDDPVQTMDEHAVHGLAAVLEEYAETLQLVVFTHDKRLIEALRSQDIDHTLINVTRSDRSQVECEPCYNPVTQRLFDARREAERWRGRGRLTHIQDATDHCRRAIEAACMRARRRMLLSEGRSGVEIKNAMDDALAGRDITTRGLMALAIFGDFDRHGDVRDRVAKDEHDKWGEWVDTTLRRVNEVMHAETAREAREALVDDLGTLINKVELLTQKIEENCSGSDHRDA